ncbi:hypothetical protein GQ473_01560 [archaeon]|nr:hypothetical protein [archaeon]
MDVFGYRDGIKEAKRLISEGRAQITAAERLNNRAEIFANTHMLYSAGYPTYEEEKEFAFDKKSTAIEKIKQGLEIYRHLLSYDNIEHFTRIKNSIKGTVLEFRDFLLNEDVDRYTNSLYVGAE